MRNLLLALGVCALLTGVGGCIIHDHGPYAEEVYIEPGHVHTEYCGHYYSHSRWYYSHGHHHGPGCGHAWRGGVWINID